MRRKIYNNFDQPKQKLTLADQLIWMLTFIKQPIPGLWCLALATLKVQANKKKLMLKTQQLLFQTVDYLSKFSIIRATMDNDNKLDKVTLLQTHEPLNKYSTEIIIKHLIETINAMRLMLTNPETIKKLQQQLPSYLECLYKIAKEKLLPIALQTTNLKSPALIGIMSLLENFQKYFLSDHKNLAYQEILTELLLAFEKNGINNDVKINVKADIYFRLGIIALCLSQTNEAIDYFKKTIALKIKLHGTENHPEIFSAKIHFVTAIAQKKDFETAFLLINHVYQGLLNHSQAGINHPETRKAKKLWKFLKAMYTKNLLEQFPVLFDRLMYYHAKAYKAYKSAIRIISSVKSESNIVIQNPYVETIGLLQTGLLYLNLYAALIEPYIQELCKNFIVLLDKKVIEFENELEKNGIISLYNKIVQDLKENGYCSEKTFELFNKKLNEFNNKKKSNDYQKNYNAFAEFLHKEYNKLRCEKAAEFLNEQETKLQLCLNKSLVEFQHALAHAYLLNKQPILAERCFQLKKEFQSSNERFVEIKQKLISNKNELETKISAINNQSTNVDLKSNNSIVTDYRYENSSNKKSDINLNRPHLFKPLNNKCKKRNNVQNNQPKDNHPQQEKQRIIDANYTQHHEIHLLLSQLIKSAETIYQQINENYHQDEKSQKELTKYSAQLEEIKKSTAQVKQHQKLIKPLETVIKGLQRLQEREKKSPQFNNNQL